MDNKILYTAKFPHHDLKFHKVWWKSDKRCGSWSGQTDRRTDRQTGRFLYTPQTMFAGSITRRGQPTRSIGVILNEGQGLRKQILEEDYPKSITADR